jgi:hypothetical protein
MAAPGLGASSRDGIQSEGSDRAPPGARVAQEFDGLRLEFVLEAVINPSPLSTNLPQVVETNIP